MEIDVYIKGDSLAYECPDCFSEITISDKDKELALALEILSLILVLNVL